MPVRSSPVSETDWLSQRVWSKFRNEIAWFCCRHAMQSGVWRIETAEAVIADVNRFVNSVAVSMDSQRRETGSSKWAAAMSLIGGVDLLKDLVAKDQAFGVRADGGDRIGILYQLFTGFLNISRCESLVSSADRLKRWGRISKVEIEVAKEGNHSGGDVDRSSLDHLSIVFARCRERYPEDHSLPRTFTTFVAYFQEFSPFFSASYDEEEHNVRITSDFIQSQRQQLVARLCLDRFFRNHPDAATAYLVKIKEHPTIDMSLDDYRKQSGHTDYAMRSMMKSAFEELKTCIETRQMLAVIGG